MGKTDIFLRVVVEYEDKIIFRKRSEYEQFI